MVEEVLFGLKTAEWEALGIAGSKYTRLGQQLAQQQSGRPAEVGPKKTLPASTIFDSWAVFCTP